MEFETQKESSSRGERKKEQTIQDSSMQNLKAEVKSSPVQQLISGYRVRYDGN